MVTADVQNIADVSEVIVLELHADFYDATGTLLGSGSATYADTEFTGSGATPLCHGSEHADTIP